MDEERDQEFDSPEIPRKPLRKTVQQVVIRQLQGDQVRRSEAFEADQGDQYLESERHELPLCVHGHLIKDMPELGGICNNCQRYLCVQCAAIMRCDICGDLTCLGDNCGTLSDDKVICARHGFFSSVWYHLRRKDAVQKPSPTGPPIQGIPPQRPPKRRTRR